MKAKELIEILKENPEASVFVASDEEGNSFGTIELNTMDVTDRMFVLYPFTDVSEQVRKEQDRAYEAAK